MKPVLLHIGAWNPPWSIERKARAPPRQSKLFSDDTNSQLPDIEEEDVNQYAPTRD